MAEAAGLSAASVRRIWQAAHGLKPASGANVQSQQRSTVCRKGPEAIVGIWLPVNSEPSMALIPQLRLARDYGVDARDRAQKFVNR